MILWWKFPSNKEANKCLWRTESGFTLLEVVMVIVIIGLLAAVSVPKFGSMVEQSRVSATKREMFQIQRAIMGDPDTGAMGYYATVGSLPSTLSNLYTDPGTGFNYYTGKGWNGPYIDGRDVDDVAGADVLYDAWDTAYVYNSGAGTLTSYGSDKVAGGTGDKADLVIYLQ